MKQEAWGHVVARLLNELPTTISEDLLDKAKVLDGMYIPTRYANGHPEGAPFEHYGKIQNETSESFERRSVNWDISGLPVSAEILVYSLPEWEYLEKKDTKFIRMLKSEAVWTYSKQA